MTSPLEREILNHYYCYPGPYRAGSENWTDAVSDAVGRFLKLGLLVQLEAQDGYNKIIANREALEPYMDALGVVPLPERRWVIPND